MHKIFIISFICFQKILCVSCLLVDGKIWNKHDKEFVRISSIPEFARLIDDSLQQSRALETHKFYGEVFKLIYYEEKNIVEFINNGESVTGVCGEMWTTLSQYLNFTLKPMESKSRNFGVRLPNGTFDGIMGAVQRSEAAIIPRTSIFPARLAPLDYTLPIWKISYRFHIKPEWKHDAMWMFDLFSLEVWCYILIMFFILSIAAYTSQKLTKRFAYDDNNFTFQDHLFYSFAIVCSQGCIPNELHSRSKLISICIGLFFWMILIAFSAHAITQMMNKTLKPPFTNLESLMNSTRYVLVAFDGSMYHDELKNEIKRIRTRRDLFTRVYFAQSLDKMYEKTCQPYSKTAYAVFEAEDRHKAASSFYCKLIPIGQPYFETWIASGLEKGNKYKRSFDIGILKLFEVGIIDCLKDRWLDWKLIEKEKEQYDSIDIEQVYIIFLIPILGALTSLVILLFEKVAFSLQNYCSKRFNRK